MSNRMRVRPTKPVTIMGLVVAVAMLIFGIVFLNLAARDSGGEPGPARAFMVVWFIALGVIIAYGIYNLVSRKGVIEIESGPTGPDKADKGDPEARLRRLEALKKDGLVTDEEYRAKRAKIMAEKW